jgi:hypothetical protein
LLSTLEGTTLESIISFESVTKTETNLSPSKMGRQAIVVAMIPSVIMITTGTDEEADSESCSV